MQILLGPAPSPSLLDLSVLPPLPLVHPVILSGGSGTRLWPLSRASSPKQLLPLASARTMIQETVARVIGPGFASPMVICNVEHRFAVAAQLKDTAVRSCDIVLETEGRNTAAAAAIAALLVSERDTNGLVLLLPSDHVIRDVPAFHAAIVLATVAAAQGLLVTFGAAPTNAATGYGYIRQGAAISDAPGCFSVSGFTEKPDADTAETYLSDGRYLWNNGIFLFRADSFLVELERFEPGIVAHCRNAVGASRAGPGFRRLNAAALTSCKSISIDYAVMEHTTKAAVVPAALGWSDVGSWDALWDLGGKDNDGNVSRGDVLLENVRNSYVRSDSRLVALLGVEDLIVVSTADAILVARRDRAQDVKRLVDALNQRKRCGPSTHHCGDRTWGSVEAVDASEHGRIRRLVLMPGARLPIEHCDQNPAHWIVMAGMARVTVHGQITILRKTEAIDIPRGATRDLENAGEIPLLLIEACMHFDSEANAGERMEPTRQIVADMPA